jgi:hypothetical protein
MRMALSVMVWATRQPAPARDVKAYGGVGEEGEAVASEADELRHERQNIDYEERAESGDVGSSPRR